MSIRKVFRFASYSSFLGVAIWACSSSGPNTGFGNPGNSSNGGNGNNSSNGNNNGNSSNGNNTYGGGNGNNTTTSNGGFGQTTNGGGNTTNTGGGSTTTTGGNTTAAGAGCGTPVLACSAAKSTGAVALANCFYSNTAGTASGYAYYFNDAKNSGTSTACVNTDSLCTSGTTNALGTPPNYNAFGAGIGFNVNQTSAGGMGTAFVPTSAGLQWAISSATTYGIQIGINAGTGICSAASGGCCFRPALTATSGTIPWSSFTTTCYNTADAGPGFSMADGIDSIQFQVNSGAALQTFNFCVTTLSF